MLRIDGSAGEGGGQILRSALSLSLCTGTPFHLEQIRAGREKPGLRRQHLTCVQAAAEIGRAQVAGASLGSREIVFEPGAVQAGEYHFDVGTAGSALLVLQTVLPPLWTAAGPSVLILEGGTHNQLAPPFEFIERAFRPLIEQLGPRLQFRLDRPGFYPAGGGKLRVLVEPAARLQRLELRERGPLRRTRAVALVSALPTQIAQRELDVVRRELGWKRNCLELRDVPNPRGPGNAVFLELAFEHVTEVFTGFGQRGVRAEQVARQAVQEAQRYLAAGVPVGEHLADQLLLPLALAGGGSFQALPLTLHAETNAATVQRFLDVEVRVDTLGPERCLVEVAPRPAAEQTGG